MLKLEEHYIYYLLSFKSFGIFIIYITFAGFPMTISLLSAQLEQYKEDVVRNQNRWDFYIKTLIDRKISDAIGYIR